MTESPGSESVGNILICVNVAWGGSIAGPGVADEPPAEVQALKINRPVNRNLDTFFMGYIGNQSTFNTYG
jgi:hypothetical protein